MIDIEGIPEDVYKIQNMLLTTGHIDAVEWCTNMLKFPTLMELSKHYDG